MAKQKCLTLSAGFNIRNRWTIKKKLGAGGFGTVYEVVDANTCETYAMKAAKTTSLGASLKVELFIMKKLKDECHICHLVDAGEENGILYLVMSLCGPNLADLRDKCPQRRFTVLTTTALAIQCTQAIRQFHSIGFIHRDVKPANFAISTNRQNRNVFLIDFGICKRYRRNDGTKILWKREKVVFGTRRYASPNVHQRKPQGPNDDMISLMYSIIEFLLDKLPWTNIKCWSKIGKMKKNMPVKQLTYGTPICVQEVCSAVFNSQDDEVDYDTIISTFQNNLPPNTQPNFIIPDWEIFSFHT